jgi:hypothetical protein
MAARAATTVDLGGLRRGERLAASVPKQAAGCLSGAVIDSAALMTSCAIPVGQHGFLLLRVASW